MTPPSTRTLQDFSFLRIPTDIPSQGSSGPLALTRFSSFLECVKFLRRLPDQPQGVNMCISLTPASSVDI